MGKRKRVKEVCRAKGYDPHEELKAILDLLGEWRNKNGVGFVNIAIMDSGHGISFTKGYDPKCEVWGEYGPISGDGGSDE